METRLKKLVFTSKQNAPFSCVHSNPARQRKPQPSLAEAHVGLEASEKNPPQGT